MELTQTVCLQIPEKHQYWSYRNKERRTEHLLPQPRMDMDTHTPSHSNSTSNRENKADFSSKTSATPWEGKPAQHLESKEAETSSEGKIFAWWCQQIESLQTHIQQNVAASQHRTFNDVFTAMTNSNPAGVQDQLECNPRNSDKQQYNWRNVTSMGDNRW